MSLSHETDVKVSETNSIGKVLKQEDPFKPAWRGIGTYRLPWGLRFSITLDKIGLQCWAIRTHHLRSDSMKKTRGANEAAKSKDST